MHFSKHENYKNAVSFAWYSIGLIYLTSSKLTNFVKVKFDYDKYGTKMTHSILKILYNMNFFHSISLPDLYSLQNLSQL